MTLDSHPCPFVIFRGNRNPRDGFEPDETCDADVPDKDGVYCTAHAWAEEE